VANLVIDYTPGPVVAPLTADLGSSGQFLLGGKGGTLAAGATDRYVFTLRPSEIHSPAGGVVYLGVEVTAAGSTRQPAVPVIPGLAPLTVRAGGGSAFALYRITREGLQQLEVSGADAATS